MFTTPIGQRVGGLDESVPSGNAFQDPSAENSCFASPISAMNQNDVDPVQLLFPNTQRELFKWFAAYIVKQEESEDEQRPPYTQIPQTWCYDHLNMLAGASASDMIRLMIPKLCNFHIQMQGEIVEDELWKEMHRDILMQLQFASKDQYGAIIRTNVKSYLETIFFPRISKKFEEECEEFWNEGRIDQFHHMISINHSV